MRLAFDWGIPPDELGERLSSQNLTEIQAYLMLKDEEEMKRAEQRKIQAKMEAPSRRSRRGGR